MFLINGIKAKLRQFNRKEEDEIFDDQNYKDIIIKVCPYNKHNRIEFGIDTDKLGIGYFIVNRLIDVRVGDQITFPLEKCANNINKMQSHTYTVQEVKNNWIFNRIENKIIRVK